MTTIEKELIYEMFDVYYYNSHTPYHTIFDSELELKDGCYYICITILKTENGHFLITESDVECPHRKKLIIPKNIPLMIRDVHDWVETIHYHIVSTRALNMHELKYILLFFRRIYKYFDSKKEIEMQKREFTPANKLM